MERESSQENAFTDTNERETSSGAVKHQAEQIDNTHQAEQSDHTSVVEEELNNEGNGVNEIEVHKVMETLKASVEAIKIELNQRDLQGSKENLELSSSIIELVEEVNEKLETSQGNEADLKKDQQQINELAGQYLNLEVKKVLGDAETLQWFKHTSPIPRLKTQLEEITTRKRKDTSGWFSRSKENKVLDSVERFAKNPALYNNSSDVILKVNVELLKTMILATYALTYFDAQNTSINATVSEETLKNKEQVNKAVLLYVHQELAKVQSRADGLIGSQNPTMQFWGKVLLAVALAITATVAAIAIMSALGFALPTFLVPYVAYLQASALVTSVLTFVSTQLSITMAASASTTALLTAGLFGGVGYGLNRAGAPTSLKKDLDQAAKDLDAAIMDRLDVSRAHP